MRDNLLSRKTARKGAALFLAQAVATTPYLFDDYHGPAPTQTVDAESHRNANKGVAATTRALVIRAGTARTTQETAGVTLRGG